MIARGAKYAVPKKVPISAGHGRARCGMTEDGSLNNESLFVT
jgi:hypothetical protein